MHHPFRKPVVTIKDVQSMTGLSPKARKRSGAGFCGKRIIVETTGYQRNRVCVYGIREDVCERKVNLLLTGIPVCSPNK